MSQKQPLRVHSMRVAIELETLELSLESIENGLERVLTFQNSSLGGAPIEMLQELDLLRQTIDALSKYLLEVSGDTDDLGQVCDLNARNSVPLKDLAGRLSGLEISKTPQVEVDLF
ncbi:MAG: hypothetical protein N4A70_13605 [Pelagimonas sp.]|jgi:hypothetical protein|nr:hypothetical protein [Pelagimonas sp.]